MWILVIMFGLNLQLISTNSWEECISLKKIKFIEYKMAHGIRPTMKLRPNFGKHFQCIQLNYYK
mgnify:CR=1 FL=1